VLGGEEGISEDRQEGKNNAPKVKMKLVQFSIGDAQRIGILDDKKVIDLKSGYAMYLSQEMRAKKARAAAEALPVSMTEFFDLQNWIVIARNISEYVGNALKSGEKIKGEKVAYELTEVKLMAPLQPRLIIDMLTFEEHFKQGLSRVAPIDLWRKTPIAYKKNPFSVIGHEESIVHPSYTGYLDYEVELGIVIGKKGKDIAKENAYEYVAGYTVFNDISARDIEMKEILLRLGPFKSKDFDTAGPMGPCIVTNDEVGDAHNLEMELRVNGEVRQKYNTKHMHWKVPEMIAYASMDQTLYPGTVIGSGTVPHLKPKRLKVGDVVEAEIEKIGILRNKVVAK
jgi:2-keto-4-pentenoate hydratase/2-oxohepta-3-ene-1,7-dioic acid hydratase in catechol pathway